MNRISKQKLPISTKKQTNDIYQKFWFCYRTHRFDAVVNIANQIKKTGASLDNDMEKAYVQSVDIVNKINYAYNQSVKPLKGWQVKKFPPQAWIAIKQTAQYIYFRHEGLFDVQPFSFCSLCYETTSYQSWVPFCTLSKELKVDSHLKKLVYIKCKPPLVNPKHLFFHVVGVDRIKENKTVVVIAQSIKNYEDYLKILIPDEQKRVKLESKLKKSSPMNITKFYLEISLREDKLNVKLYGELKKSSTNIPTWLISFMMKEVGSVFIEKVVKHAQGLDDTKWKEEGSDKKQFYQNLIQRLDNWKMGILKKSKL